MTERGKSGIYAITCMASGKQYVGQAASLGDRWLTHRSHLNRGRHANRHLQSAWNKHGAEAFEFVVLAYVTAEKEALAQAEQWWVDKFAPEFNLAPVSGSSLGLKHPPRSDEFRKRMGDMKRGFKHRPETIQRLREIAAEKAYRHSAETLARMAAAPRPAFVMTPARVAMYEQRKGKPITQEHRDALLRSITGRSVSEETRAKIGAANANRASPARGKPRPQHVIDAMAAGRRKWLEARRAFGE